MQSLKSPIFETCALGFKNIKCVLLQLCSASPCRWDMEQKTSVLLEEVLVHLLPFCSWGEIKEFTIWKAARLVRGTFSMQGLILEHEGLVEFLLILGFYHCYLGKALHFRTFVSGRKTSLQKCGVEEVLSGCFFTCLCSEAAFSARMRSKKAFSAEITSVLRTPAPP